MVKRTFRKRMAPLKAKRSRSKSFAKLKRYAAKKSYSKGYKPKKYRRVVQKSLKHTLDIGGKGIDDNSTEKIALLSMMNKSAKTFDIQVSNNIISLGTLGVNSIGTSIVNALTDKHVHLTSGISQKPNIDTAYQLVKPQIHIKGISFRRNGFVEAGSTAAKDIIDFTSVPICQYQFTESTPLNFFTFNAGKCYIKIPKVINGEQVTYPMPKHLNFFNCWAARIKVYYTIGHKTGFSATTKDQELTLEEYELQLKSEAARMV